MNVWSIVVVVIMLGVLVTIHELGHFWVASLLKIKAFEVSIFVGPRLIHWTRKGVDYSIRLIPLGAYVRFSDIDENGEAVNSDAPDLLINQPRWKRLLVALAGPFMNVVLGVLIFAVLFWVTGFTSLDIGTTPKGSQLSSQEYTVGDHIVAVNGQPVYTYLDFYFAIDNEVRKVDPMTVTLKSAETGKKYDVVLTPETKSRPMLGITTYQTTDNKYKGWEILDVDEKQNNGKPVLKVGDFLTAVDGKAVADEDFLEFLDTRNEGDTMKLTFVRNGVTMEKECIKTMITYANDRGLRILSYNVNSPARAARAFGYAAKMPLAVVILSYKSISNVFEGKEEVYNMVSGPVGVTTVVNDVVGDVDDNVGDKIYMLIVISGIISIGLTFTNLLPIPGLDGVQIILIVVEMIIGRRLSKKAEGVINVVGFFLLIALVLFAFASDIIRIFVER
ncbi:MAG: RIP metalloprotease RseP [Clostridiales bacterium]|nr:RIP metalloprotease RseP [Clostridiales bacterium]